MGNNYIFCEGFDPIINDESKVLILGTLPPADRSWYY